ncbi:MAG: basic amino acid ABC transporter substrate-binding protein [Mogibacterium sp.]|nr:basic amino acid ABC transporter substrate-binding protein [Mogibacterium sp.]
MNNTKHTWKKTVTALIALICMFAITMLTLAACGSSGGSGEDEDPGEKKVLIVGTEPTYAPFDTVDDDGNVIGFDMDLIQAIADDQGFEIEFMTLEFDALIPALESGQIDIIAAAMNGNNPERQKKVDFSDPYYETGLVVVVDIENDKIGSIEDFDTETVACSQIGSVGADIITEMEADGKIKKAVVNNGFDVCLLQVMNGDVDATIMSKPTAENAIKKYPGELKIVGDKLDEGWAGFAVQKGNTELLDKINVGLAHMKENGTYDDLLTKWFADYEE